MKENAHKISFWIVPLARRKKQANVNKQANGGGSGGNDVKCMLTNAPRFVQIYEFVYIVLHQKLIFKLALCMLWLRECVYTHGTANSCSSNIVKLEIFAKNNLYRFNWTNKRTTNSNATRAWNLTHSVIVWHKTYKTECHDFNTIIYDFVS